jgi:hypothetical protein
MLKAGTIYGFYVHARQGHSIEYSNAATPTTFSNADMVLTTYYGKGSPAFTGPTNSFRTWNGTVYTRRTSPRH